jgi:hypothetical protein
MCDTAVAMKRAKKNAWCQKYRKIRS